VSTTEYTRQYRAAYPEKYAAQLAAQSALRDLRSTKANLGVYGITLAQYDELLAAQSGLCAICRQPETRKYRGKTLMSLSVDHIDLEDGPLVRGLLCHSCNLALGFLRDDPDLAIAAATYLKLGGG